MLAVNCAPLDDLPWRLAASRDSRKSLESYGFCASPRLLDL